MDKALVTLYPSATPSLAAPTLDRVRLPAALAQQLFPVSCGSDHKTEESEKAAASVLAIEGPKAEGEESEEEEVKAPVIHKCFKLIFQVLQFAKTLLFVKPLRFDKEGIHIT